MPRPLTGLLVSVAAFALCGAAFAVQTDARHSQPPAALPPAEDNVRTDDAGDQVVVLIGDSLTELAILDVRDRFADDAALRLSAHYYGGTEFDTRAWLELYPHVGQGSVVLLFLGINDLRTGSIDDAVAHATRAIDVLTGAGARRVVVATVNTTGQPAEVGLAWEDKVRAYNDWLIVAAADDARFPALEVVRWDEASEGHEDWLQEDGVHLTTTGADAYAEAIYDAAG